METKSRNVSKTQKEGTNITFEKANSAYELGELMNKEPLALLDLDLGYQTRWYNCDFIEETMSFIREENDMIMFISLVVNCWHEQIVKRHPRVAYRDTKTKQMIPYVEDLDIKLNDIYNRLMGEREQIKKASAFREMFLKQYGCPSNNPENPTHQITEPNLAKQPVEPAHDVQYTVLLEDLPKDIRSIFLLDQYLFNVFVKQMNEDTWPIVEAQKGTLCDALRFVCIKRNILAGNTDREIFDKFLHKIVKVLENEPSLVSSMKRRTDTSTNVMKRNLGFYDSPVKRHQDLVWQLKKDCEPIEESLQPVYEAMESRDS